MGSGPWRCRQPQWGLPVGSGPWGPRGDAVVLPPGIAIPVCEPGSGQARGRVAAVAGRPQQNNAVIGGCKNVYWQFLSNEGSPWAHELRIY